MKDEHGGEDAGRFNRRRFMEFIAASPVLAPGVARAIAGLSAMGASAAMAQSYDVLRAAPVMNGDLIANASQALNVFDFEPVPFDQGYDRARDACPCIPRVSGHRSFGPALSSPHFELGWSATSPHRQDEAGDPAMWSLRSRMIASEPSLRPGRALAMGGGGEANDHEDFGAALALTDRNFLTFRSARRTTINERSSTSAIKPVRHGTF